MFNHSHIHITVKQRDKAAAWLAGHTGIKLVKPTIRSENLSPRVTISRIRQAIKDKLRQSMITTAEMNGKNAIVNQTKIDELINKSFKKRLHHQFWQQLKTIHGITNKK